jgi:SAM-dependent methyltransferase
MSALAALRPPPGRDALPAFDRGWRVGAGAEPFLAYEQVAELHWSAELEALHEESSRDHFIDLLTRWSLLRGIRPAVRDGALVVDVGCSSGYLLADLRAAHPSALTIGVDLVAEGLRRAHAEVPEAPLLLADCLALPFEDASVDAIVSANVLEHIADDATALREMRRILRPGGLAAVVVPAGPGLFDAYDEHLGHERRYARGELAARGRSAGLELLDDAYLGALVYPPFWLAKKYNLRRHADLGPDERRALAERSIGQTQGSRLGDVACTLERELLSRRVRLPFGIRSSCVFRRPA